MKTILVDAVDTFVIEGAGIFKEMHDLLEQYPNRKIILTNASDEQMVEFGLQNLPYELFTMKHNPDKTDPRYFETMLKHFGLNKGDVVYFEHNEDAVKSARSLGIIAYHYDPTKKRPPLPPILPLPKPLTRNTDALRASPAMFVPKLLV